MVVEDHNKEVLEDRQGKLMPQQQVEVGWSVRQTKRETVEMVEKEIRMQLVGGQKAMVVLEAAHAVLKVLMAREAVMVVAHTDIHGLELAVAA